MTKPELKAHIVTHMLKAFSKKALLETNEKVSTFYDEPNGRKELSDEVYEELIKTYKAEE